jgi:hypothetical protein
MEILGQLLVWVKWLGITGILAGVALLIFAPALARVAGEFLMPLAKGAGELIVWFVRDILWEGFKDMTDNLASIIFVITAILVGGWLMSPSMNCKPAVDRAITDLRKDYKFIARTPAEKRAWQKQQNQAAPCWYCLW